MKLGKSRRRALVALAGVVWACGGLQAASPALAYDDKTTITSFMELVGVSSGEDPAKIDYRERPKIVLPPSRGALPEPQARSDARPGGWPTGPEVVRRRNSDRFARAPQPGASQGSTGAAEPSRDLLTEPPGGYRHATQDLSKIRDPDTKGSWWNPLSYFGRDDNKNAGKDRGADHGNEGGAISSLSSMIPRFVRGRSDND
jgi:hypothetical protein